DALCGAACTDSLDVVKYLLAHGADIHARNDDAFRWAARKGHLATMEYLLAHGADIHAKNNYALYWASRWWNFATVACILHHSFWCTAHIAQLVECVQSHFATDPMNWCRVRCEDDAALP